jgi:putative acetyltransferase
MFHDYETLEETIAAYATEWPLHDMEDIQKHYLDNGGTFLVLLDDGVIVGTGSLNRLEEGVGEIKRLWLLADYQGKGWGYRMMQQLLDEARRQRYTKVRLETNPEYQQRAYLFYKKLGIYDIPRYGSEFDDIGMELIL